MMKRLFILSFLLLGFFSVNVIAQDTEEITDEELAKFAAMEDSVLAFYEMKNEELITMIKENEVIDGAGRYNDIKAAWGNEEKMAEIEVTEEEKTAYQEILDFMGSLSEEVRDLKVGLIKDEDVLGAATYNKINNAIKSNPEVKEKVDNLIAQLKTERTNEDEN
ncbi:hypothetical protein [Pararhodonellum marinum]|uniref:hypothetical protein n=1 Tax=Pararhodonellum marinum TaxID=2755358 RepID=UPI00293BE044|nr:hypothetical protein [Pararhodonellum marinum]